MKDSESFEILYTGSSEIDLESWERIIHSLITYGHRVWLHSSVQISPRLPDRLRQLIGQTFYDLKEDGLIRTWEYETSLDMNVIPDKVLDREIILDLYTKVNDQITSYDSQGTLAGNALDGVELTSKIIQYRHELWNIGLSYLLDVNALCYARPSVTTKGVISNFYQYELINRQYTETLFKQLNIPPLGFLTCQDIKDLQKYSDALRDKLRIPISNKVPELPPSKRRVRAECQAVVDEMNAAISELAREKSLRKLGLDITKDSALASLGLLFPTIALIPLAETLAFWLKDNSKYSFLFFAIDIKKRAIARYSDALENRSMELLFSK